MKKILILIISLVPLASKGQFAGYFPTVEPTFGQIKQRAKTYYDSLLLAKGTLQGTGYTSYKRWEYFWDSRIGDAPKISEVKQKVENYYNTQNSSSNANLPEGNYNCSIGGNTWEEVGPNTFPSNNGDNYAYQRGIGMISFVRFHPQYNGGTQQTMYTGGVSGLWKSINNGQSWSVLNTDGNKFTSCADLAISPTSPNILYIGTGAEKSMSLFNVFGEPYEEYYGVLRSNDGGNSWLNISPPDNSIQYATKKVGRIRTHPTNPDVVYLVLYYHSWDNGSHWGGKIYKSINKGNTWNTIYTTENTHLLDMEFKPDDPNTFYVAGYRLLKFTDTETSTSVLTPTDITSQLGTGWQANTTRGVVSGEGHVNRLEIEVTQIAPNNLYVVGSDFNPTDGERFENLWVSNNSGTSFTARNPPDLSGDGYNVDLDIVRQMMCLAISPNNANEIYMGGIALGKSTNGGSSFTKLNTGHKIHPDNRELECVMNGTNTTLFTCNDAGLYISSDAGSTWQTRSTGLGVGRIYGLDIANTPLPQSTEKIIAGFQDCTTLIKDQTGWFQPTGVGGDGMLTAIDPIDNNIMYRESQNGFLDRSIDGINFSSVNSGVGFGNWVTPFMLFPTNSKKMIVGRENVNIIDFTTNSSGTGTVKTNPLRHNSPTNNAIQSVAVAASNDNVIYAAYKYGRDLTGSQIDRFLFKTTDGGNNWTDISPIQYSNTNAPINAILIHPNNPNKIWIAMGSYGWTPAQQVLLTSNDGGITWIPFADGLGFMPIMSLAINPNRVNDEELYIGTDAGVFFRNKYMSQWECFNNLLPNIRVTDLKVNRHKKTIFAGTFGRGVWKSSLFCPSVPSYTLPTTPLNFYAASNSISSSSTISGTNRQVAYRAPSIYLTTGFKVVLGTAFSANSYSCQEYVINKIVQNNSNTNSSTTLKKEYANSDITNFQVHPIPTFSEITTKYELEVNSNVYIYLTDGTGKLVRNLLRVHEQEIGKYEQKFQLGDIPNGYYLVVMESNKGISHQKIIIQK